MAACCMKAGALPHFNEVDECAGLDALVTNRVWTRLGYDPETTLHDVRYGEAFHQRREDFVWVFEISGSVPPAASDRRLCGRGQRAPAAHVLPPGRRHHQRHQQAGRDRLEPRLRRSRQAESGHRPRPSASSCRAKKPSAAGASPRRNGRSCTRCSTASRRDQFMARTQVQPHPGGLCARCRGRQLALAAKAAMFREMGIEVSVCGTGHGL